MRWLAFGAIGVLVGGGCSSSKGSEQASTGGGGGMANVAGRSATAGATSSGTTGAPPAECDLSSLTTTHNEAGIGAGCVDSSQAREFGACGANFCISRPLSDRWTEGVGFCSKHCEATADCGAGFECCEPRPGPVCVPYEEHAVLGSGCAERCAGNHLNCPKGEICCERVGKLCISELCSNVCP
jgi:hypothetical protein